MSTPSDPSARPAEIAALRRARDLALRGPARGVNPRVGCVILAPDGTVLAEGWHRGAGTAHAEVDALSALGPGDARGATAIVTLEPCNHTGRTGPCAEALLHAGIARVLYAVADPGAASSGGAQRLRAAGVDVDGGEAAFGAEECVLSAAILGDWLPAARRGRPLITVKWASTLDGRAAAADGSSQWITGAEARADVHRRRADADAIAVGTGTVLADDPALTARGPEGLLPRQPRPVVFGHRPVPAGARLHAHPAGKPVLLTGDDLPADLTALHASGIRHLFVEGGPRLASSFLAAGLADELLVYLAPALLGGPRTAIDDLGITGMDGIRRFRFTHVERLGEDILLIARTDTDTAPEISR